MRIFIACFSWKRPFFLFHVWAKVYQIVPLQNQGSHHRLCQHRKWSAERCMFWRNQNLQTRYLPCWESVQLELLPRIPLQHCQFCGILSYERGNWEKIPSIAVRLLDASSWELKYSEDESSNVKASTDSSAQAPFTMWNPPSQVRQLSASSQVRQLLFAQPWNMNSDWKSLT